ncbi:MAG: PSD1 and planctomycete cytochrome C domain-containing protein [Pirellulales bacterium]
MCCAAIVLHLGLVSPVAAQEPPIDFAHDVVPILKSHCVECHSGVEPEGAVSMDSRELLLDAAVVLPGEAADSRLIELVTSRDPEDQMPPKDRPRLAGDQVDVLRRWIDQGLAWEEGFTFAPRTYEPPLRPRQVELPPPVDGRENPIDRILDAYLAEHSLPRPAAIDDATFIRRVYLDLVGLLPDPDVLQAFLDDPSSDKRARLVQNLLQDRRAYTAHWLTFWNDLLRNDYAGTGYIDGGRKQITAWLVESLLANKPYDQFVRELVAPSPESEGFIHGIKWRGNVNSSQQPEIQFAQNLGQVFLGINLKCASCHDSFIDRWTLEETYSLAAVYSERPLELHRCDKPTGQSATAAWLFPELGQIDVDAPQSERLAQLARLMTDPENGRVTRTIVNRLWHRLMGRGIVHPVDAMQTEPYSADLLDYLGTYLAEHDYDLKRALELIATSQAYQSQTVVLDEEPAPGTYVYTGPVAKRMTAEQFMDSVWQITDAGPTKAEAPVEWPPASSDSDEQLPVRASLVKSDLLMRSLGRPNREQVVTTRPDTLTTLQAIDLSNGEILAGTLAEGATRIIEQQPGESAKLVERLYWHGLSRRPTDQEREIAIQLVGGAQPMVAGVEDLLWAIVMLPEFQIIR